MNKKYIIINYELKKKTNFKYIKKTIIFLFSKLIKKKFNI